MPKFGGIGGNGGNVIVKGDRKTHSLLQLKRMLQSKKLRAGNGEDSRRTRLVGQSGYDLFLKCPLGSVVMGDQGNVLAEINQDEEELMLPLGGQGGCKDNGFFGMRGRKQHLKIDLRLISDVGELFNACQVR